MHKTRFPLYILEELICDGYAKSLSFRCDRSCYFMWHEHWLENSSGVKKCITHQSCADASTPGYPKYLGENSECLLECQLTSIQSIVGKNSSLNNTFQKLVRILGELKNRLILYFKTWVETSQPVQEEKSGQDDDELDLQTGDIVRVKKAHEIHKILDRRKRFGGCPFAREMYIHCDQAYRVLKPIRSFYDEAKRRVCKNKKMVILENVTCSGKFRLYPWRCNRTCFFFWREEWLEKVTNQ